MKHTKLWATIMFSAIITSIMLIAFAAEQPKIVLVKPSQVREYFKPPENATVIPDLKPILFDLSLSTGEITISKRQSMNIMITIRSIDIEKTNLSLTVLALDVVPDLTIPTELPSGIIASFDAPEISVDSGSEVTANLILTVSDQASSGTYTLQVCAIQKTLHGSVAVGAAFRLIVQ